MKRKFFAVLISLLVLMPAIASEGKGILEGTIVKGFVTSVASFIHDPGEVSVYSKIFKTPSIEFPNGGDTGLVMRRTESVIQLREGENTSWITLGYSATTAPMANADFTKIRALIKMDGIYKTHLWREDSSDKPENLWIFLDFWKTETNPIYVKWDASGKLLQETKLGGELVWFIPPVVEGDQWNITRKRKENETNFQVSHVVQLFGTPNPINSFGFYYEDGKVQIWIPKTKIILAAEEYGEKAFTLSGLPSDCEREMTSQAISWDDNKWIVSSTQEVKFVDKESDPLVTVNTGNEKGKITWGDKYQGPASISE